MKSLQDGLNALLTMFPGNTGADVRAVWDKVQADAPLGTDIEQRIAVEIHMNRAALETLAAQETAAVRATLRQQAEAALVDLRAYRDLPSPTNAQTVLAVKLLCRVAIGLIRLTLRKLDAAT